MNGAAGAPGAAGSQASAAGASGAAMSGTGGAGGAAATAGAAAPTAGSGVTMMIPMGWASGGTKSMKGGYPDPFATAPMGAMCVLYPSQTLGPCYSAMPMMREDISSGTLGLPVRLSFLVVKNGCTPIPNATVDIWHSGYNGIYSAYATNTTCNPTTMDVKSENFCRGVQATDAMGRANFNTVFPGWYSGRAVHIHFTVRVNGTEEVTSQLYFEDDLVTEIQAQGEYKVRGMRSTLNAGDAIFRSGGAKPDQVIMETAKRADGVLHAWKVLSIG
jgi:protocatechuate 3,4-dioxygenase beta subunit